MVHGARARNSQLDTLRPRLGVIGQFLQAFYRHIGIHQQHDGVLGNDRYRRQILLYVVGHAGIQRDTGCQWRRRIDHDGVTIWRHLFCHARGAYLTPATGDVLDDDLLAHGATERITQHPTENVDRATGRIRHDEAQGFIGIRLCLHAGR